MQVPDRPDACNAIDAPPDQMIRRAQNSEPAVFQYAKVGLSQLQAFGCFGYRLRDQFQALHGCVRERSRGCKTKNSAQSAKARSSSPRKRPLGLAMKLRGGAGQIHQKRPWRRGRCRILRNPRMASHCADANAYGCHCRARRKNLKPIRSQPVGPLHRQRHRRYVLPIRLEPGLGGSPSVHKSTSFMLSRLRS